MDLAGFGYLNPPPGCLFIVLWHMPMVTGDVGGAWRAYSRPGRYPG